MNKWELKSLKLKEREDDLTAGGDHSLAANVNEEPFFNASIDGLEELNRRLILRANQRRDEVDFVDILSKKRRRGKHAARIHEPLDVMALHQRLSLGFEIKSHRRIQGPFLIFGKKLVRRLLTWLFEPMLEQQTLFNEASCQLHEYNLAVIEELESRILELESEARRDD